MGELHLLRLFADHHQQYHSQEDARRNQHFSIRKPLLEDKRKDRNHARKNQAEQRSLQHDTSAQSQIIALQKEHDLEAFAVKRGKAEEEQSPLYAPPRDFRGVRIFEQFFSAAIVRTDPASPINLVEEPIHDHE